MFRLVRALKTDNKVVEGGSDGKLCYSEEEGGKFWKDYMDKIISKENDWGHNVEGDAVDGSVVCVMSVLCHEGLPPWVERSACYSSPG